MTDVTDGIREYLAAGGLFNPELMDHQRVRNLVIECRDEIERLREINAGLQTAFDEANEETQRYGELLRSENRRIVEREREIEQLRGLLVEPLGLYKMDFDEYAKWLNDWERRVREALGE